MYEIRVLGFFSKTSEMSVFLRAITHRFSMYLTGFQGLIRAHLYQKPHYVAGGRKALTIVIVNLYGVIVCDTVQVEKRKMS